MSETRLPVYRIVNGTLVRKEGDVRDPTRRYAQVGGPDGSYLREFTDEEEHQRDQEEAQWAADAPRRDAEAKQREVEAQAFRESLKYETRLVAFIDILGWTRAVRSSPTDHAKTRSLGLAVHMMRQYTQFWNSVASRTEDSTSPTLTSPDNPKITHFSDCLIISTAPSVIGREHIVSALGLLSLALLQQGFLLRGGIAVGDMYHEDSVAFGPALLEAYDLERTRAIYPRIILQPALADAWGDGVAYLDAHGSVIDRERTWRLGEDGYRFFDFLQPFGGAKDFRESHGLIRGHLEPLRTVVTVNLQLHREDSDVWRKYVWLAHYFNTVCDEYPRCGVERIALTPN